jgi:hypothetical protein
MPTAGINIDTIDNLALKAKSQMPLIKTQTNSSKK